MVQDDERPKSGDVNLLLVLSYNETKVTPKSLATQANLNHGHSQQFRNIDKVKYSTLEAISPKIKHAVFKIKTLSVSGLVLS